VASQREHHALHAEDVAERAPIESREDTLFEIVEGFVERVEDREEGVDGRVEDRVHHPRAAASQQVGVLDQTRHRRLDGLRARAVRRDQEVRPEEEVQVQRVDVVRIARPRVEPYAARDDEEKAFVLLVLDATVRVERVLDRQWMEVKDLVEHRVLVPVRHVDVDPQHPLAILEGIA
jgi:hypothetical protein